MGSAFAAAAASLINPSSGSSIPGRCAARTTIASPVPPTQPALRRSRIRSVRSPFPSLSNRPFSTSPSIRREPRKLVSRPQTGFGRKMSCQSLPRYFTPAPIGPGPPPSHHDADLGVVYRGGVFPGFVLFTRSTLLPFRSAPTPFGSCALSSPEAIIPHSNKPQNKRTRLVFILVPPAPS